METPPRPALLMGLTLLPCLVLGAGGCRGFAAFDSDERVTFCPFSSFTFSDARELDGGEGGWISGLCSSSECGQEHPLAVGAQGRFALYAVGSPHGALTSSDPDVIRVEQAEVETTCVEGEGAVRVTGTFEVVGPGTSSIGWTRDGSEQAGITLHAARADRLSISFKTSSLDGVDIDWDAGTYTPEEDRIPSLQEVEGGVVARVGRGFGIKLVAYDRSDRRLVLAGGPTSDQTFFDSELVTSPDGLLDFDAPHGGANIIYNVTVEEAGEGTLQGSIPDLGLSATRSLRTLEPEDYDAALTSDDGPQP